jgi:hypothetical protein
MYLGGKGEAAAADALQFLEVAGWRDGPSQFMVLIAHLGYRQAGRTAEAQKALEEAGKNIEKYKTKPLGGACPLVIFVEACLSIDNSN